MVADVTLSHCHTFFRDPLYKNVNYTKNDRKNKIEIFHEMISKNIYT